MTCNKYSAQEWQLYYQNQIDSSLSWQMTEHLAQCSDCASVYMNVTAKLLTPMPVVVKSKVMKNLQEQKKKKLYSLVATYVIAAGFAFIFYTIPLFSANALEATGFPPQHQVVRQVQALPILTGNKIIETITGFTDSLLTKIQFGHTDYEQ